MNGKHIPWFMGSNQGVRHILSKVDAIKKIYVQTKVCDVRRFVGILHYSSYMWRKHTHTLAHLTKLSTNVKLEWTDVEQEYFMATKK